MEDASRGRSHVSRGLIRVNIVAYIRAHTAYFVFTVLVYALGCVFGALAIPALTSAERAELTSYVDVFIRGLARNSPSLAGLDIMRVSLANHFRIAGLIWMLGITVIGLPVVIVILFTRGFVAGFSAGFLAAEMGARGMLLATVAMVPHSLVLLPATLTLSVASLAFGISLIKQTLAHRKVAFIQDLASYTGLLLLVLVFFALASAIEAHITPVFIRILSAYLV